MCPLVGVILVDFEKGLKLGLVQGSEERLFDFVVDRFSNPVTSFEKGRSGLDVCRFDRRVTVIASSSSVDSLGCPSSVSGRSQPSLLEPDLNYIL